MIAEIFISYSNILLIFMGGSVFILALSRGAIQYQVLGFVLVACNWNAPNLQRLFAETLGFGVAIPGLITLVLMAILMLRGRVKSLPQCLLGAVGLLVSLLVPVTALSLFQSDSDIDVIKAIISLSLVILSGWFLFGKLASLSPNPRKVTMMLVNSLGVYSLILITSLIIFAGPFAYRQQIGGTESLLNIFGVVVSRLQLSGFNATGVGSTAAVGIFWGYWLLCRWKGFLAKSLSTVIITIFIVALIWSGSRGAMASFMLTAIALLTISMQWKSIKVKSLLRAFFIIVVIGLVVALVSFVLFENLIRGGVGGGSDLMSVIELFLLQRVYNESNSGLSLLNNITLFGIGYGSLAMSSGSDNASFESFWLRIFIELGIVGSIVYSFVFLVLSSYVIAADRRARMFSNGWAFLPSSLVIFVWINGLTSWGFSIPNASLLLYVAIMSSAYVTFLTYKLNQKTGRDLCLPSQQ